MIGLNADLSQVESRAELMLAAASDEFIGTDVAKECVRMATAMPWEFDIHTWTAAVALDKSEKDVTDKAPEGMASEPSDRQIGKTSGHGFMRGIGAQTQSDTLLKMGYVVPVETCQLRLDRLAAKLPAIPFGYFPDVQRQCMRYRGLATTYGGIWRCDDQKLEEPLYAIGYSYQPQRETVDLLNQEGLLPLRDAIRLRRLTPHPTRPTPRIHVHGHDSLFLSVHPDDCYDVMAFLDRTLGRCERRYAAGTLRVPVTYGIGETWKARYEWKRLPSREEVRDAAWDCEARVKR